MRRDYTGMEFHRPTNSLFSRALGRFLPEPPKDQVVLSYDNLRHHARPVHYVLTVPVAAITYGLLWLVISSWGFIALSPATLVISCIVWVYHQGWLWFMGAAALGFGLSGVSTRLQRRYGPEVVWSTASSFGRTPGFLGKSAVFEEQWFREGSEEWSVSGRIRANIVFGLMHIPTMIYPFIWIAVLPIGGMALTRVYNHNFKKTGNRREATMEAAIYHWVFNVTMVTFFLAFLAYSLVTDVVGIF